MRLVNPGEGDELDRITVLTLKRLVVPTFGEAEYAALLDGKELGHAALQVQALNARVWEREDALRALGRLRQVVSRIPPDCGERAQAMLDELIAELALGTRRLNDQRHEILAELNGYKEKV